MRLVQKWAHKAGWTRWIVVCDYPSESGVVELDIAIFDNVRKAYRCLIQTPKHLRIRRRLTLTEIYAIAATRPHPTAAPLDDAK